MSDIVANAPAMGSEAREPEVLLAEDPDAHFRARLDELREAERALLTANISIGRGKDEAAQRKANLLAIEDIAAEARSLQDYLARAAWHAASGKAPAPARTGAASAAAATVTTAACRYPSTYPTCT
jgi:hypothetical protein